MDRDRQEKKARASRRAGASDTADTAPRTDERQEPWPRWAHNLVLALALAFVCVQLAVPLAPFFIHPSEARTDFSWDMFAVRRDCRQCNLMVSHPNSGARRYGWGKLYKTTYQAARTRNKTRLSQAAREVCRREAAAGRVGAQVYVECNCQYNRGEFIDLDVFGGDYCSPQAAERFGGAP